MILQFISFLTHITEVHSVGCFPHLGYSEPLFHLPGTTATSLLLRRLDGSGQSLRGIRKQNIELQATGRFTSL